MKFNVGQILYLLPKKNIKIIPSQVVEEIVKRKISGEEVTYMVMLPDEDRSIIDITKLDVDVFTDAASIRTHMVENAIKSIDDMLDTSVEISKKIFIDGNASQTSEMQNDKL